MNLLPYFLQQTRSVNSVKKIVSWGNSPTPTAKFFSWKSSQILDILHWKDRAATKTDCGQAHGFFKVHRVIKNPKFYPFLEGCNLLPRTPCRCRSPFKFLFHTTVGSWLGAQGAVIISSSKLSSNTYEDILITKNETWRWRA